MRTLLAMILAACAGLWQAPPPRTPAEHSVLRLHYVQKPIGYERDEIVANDAGRLLTSDFDFTDRGGRVQLAATLQTTPDYTPIHFTAKGKSYRFVNVDSDVAIDGDTAQVHADGADARVPLPPRFYTVDGYAPFAAQTLMLRYWKTHGRPTVLSTVPGLPKNDVSIESRGRDAIRVGSQTFNLEQFVVDGVVWGRETIWLDDRDAMAAAITRAGGLSFEAVREDLEPALVTFVEHATRDRIKDLEHIAPVSPPARAAYAVLGATVIDGTGRPPVPDSVIIVRDGRIAEVGPRASVTLPPGMPTIDMSGKTIVPGLWDMHSHVTQVEWAPVYLAAGVTTVRDMGNEFEFITALREAINTKRAAGPRLLLAGLVDAGGPNAFGVYYATTPDEAKQVIAKYHDAHFEQMKIYSLITPPMVAAITAEAHRVGMTVTGHVPNGMTIDQAALAGMDHVAHLAIRGEAHSDDVNRIVGILKERKTVVDPTQSWNELLGHAAGTPVAAFQPGIAKIPAPLNRIFSNAGTAGIDAAGARARVERGLRIVKQLHDAGVPIVAGTDEGVPGYSVDREIELYVEAGFTPMEALQAATIVSARAMKLDGELGTIERGKRADFVVLDASPLEAIRNIRRVNRTVIDGCFYDPAELWRSVRFQP